MLLYSKWYWFESSQDSVEGGERVIVWYKNILVLFHCYVGLKLIVLSQCCFS